MRITPSICKNAALLSLLLSLPLSMNTFADEAKGPSWIYTQTSASNKELTPDKALQMLKDGNARFVANKPKNRDLLKQAKLTSQYGQYPFAIILSCMDSRGAPEMIFDQGIGDVFSTRLAGNVLDVDQLGGIEYATKLVGSHLIVVMGHTQCGAVSGSCGGAELGNLTQLLDKIHPAVEAVKKQKDGAALNCKDGDTVNEIAKVNVMNVIKSIQEQSPIVAEQIKNGEVKIVGAMHDLRTGKVTFIE